VHHSQNPRVLILEYEVQGKAVRTGIPYHNRFVSIITEDRALEGLHGLAGRHVCAQRLRMTSRRENNHNGTGSAGHNYDSF
jgi:hypothetical protein